MQAETLQGFFLFFLKCQTLFSRGLVTLVVSGGTAGGLDICQLFMVIYIYVCISYLLSVPPTVYNILL